VRPEDDSALLAPSRWFITGGSGGLGLAMVRALLARGDTVAATARNTDALSALRKAFPQRLHVQSLDMTDLARIAPAVDRAVDCLGGLDVVVSNAGYAVFGAAEEATDAQVQQQIDTLLLGPMHLMRAALPHFRKQRHGRIVQISSESGQLSLPGLSLYQAGKWGMEGFCEALAQETSSLGFHVVIVSPGRIATAFDRNVVRTEPIEEYRTGGVGALSYLVESGRLQAIGDPVKMADAIVAAASARSPPARLILGSDALRNVRRALEQRLRLVEEQATFAASTDSG